MVETIELTAEQIRSRRKRSVAMAWCLVALVVAFFVGTMTKIQTTAPGEKTVVSDNQTVGE